MNEIWTEKYRPKTLDDFQTHKAIIRTLRWYVQQKDMPNLLYYGEPGIGKTALVHAYGRELYGEYFNDNFTEKNASDDRGINVVRTDIKEYAEYAPEGDFDFKILYLGEIDGLTKDAQDALKRTIETSADTVRFMADCNSLRNLIPAIKSRFCRIFVRKPSTGEVAMKLHDIADSEGVMDDLDEKTIVTIAETASDMRNAIQLLQALPFDGLTPITPDFVKQLAPNPSPLTVANLVTSLFNKADPKEREQKLSYAMEEAGWDGYAVLELMYDLIYKKDAKDLHKKSMLLDIIGEYMHRLSQPSNKMIQMRCCLSAMQAVIG